MGLYPSAGVILYSGVSSKSKWLPADAGSHFASSIFIERITPYAWNAGQASSYKGRNNVHKENNDDVSTTIDFLFSPFFIKIIIGIILGIVMMVNGAGGFEMIISGPLFIFLMSFIIKIFS